MSSPTRTAARSTTLHRRVRALLTRARERLDEEPAAAREDSLAALALLADVDDAPTRSGVHAHVLAAEAHARLGELEAADRHGAAALSQATSLADGDAPSAGELVTHAALTRASTLRARGAYGEAREILERLLGALRLPPRGHPPVALLNELGVTLKCIGDYRAAEACYRRAMTALRRDPDLDVLATLCHNLGGILHAQGRFIEAERHARRGLRVRLAKHGDADHAVALDRAALAAILFDRGRIDEAIDLLEAARASHRARFGADHVEVAYCTLMLARCVAAGPAPALAIPLGEEAVRLYQARVGPDHPDTAYARGTLAVVLLAAGLPGPARIEAERSHASLRTLLGEEHTITRDAKKLILECD